MNLFFAPVKSLYFCVLIVLIRNVQLRNYILLLFAVSLLSACNFDDDNNGGSTKPSASSKVFLRASQSVDSRAADESDIFIIDESINVGDAPTTRTQPGEVGDGSVNSLQTISWSDDDKFIAWAAPVAVSGEASTNYADGFNGVTFSLDHYNATYGSADFSATIPNPMSESNQYDYYAAYPIPSSKSGTQVTYDLPSTQKGDFSDKMDVMRASVRGCALIERNPNQISTPVWPEPALSFEHLMHVLRIYVPEGKNMMTSSIASLEITFPDNVVGGAVTFDAARPNVAPIWSGQTNKVRIAMLDNRLNAGGRYVWVFIKPTTLSGEIKFRAFNHLGEPSQLISTTVSNRDFQAQHITPVNLTIPAPLQPITFTLQCPDNTSYPNFLGEKATEMHIYEWPAGIVAEKVINNKINSSNGTGTFKMTFYYEAGELNTELPGKTLKVGFVSQHADVRHNQVSITLPTTLTTGGKYTLNFALPYLFYEDFDYVGDTTSNDEYKTSSTGNKDGVSINGLSGWTGARVGSSAKVSVRLAPRYESVLGGATYPSRIDSAPLSRLQAESTVAVFYNYGMDAQYGGLGGSVKTMYCYTGYVTSNDTFGGGDGDGTFPDEYDMKEQGASYKSMPHSRTAVLNNIPASVTRITWRAKTENPGGASNCTCWLYVDNVKVSVGSVAKHTGEKYRTFFPNHQN